MAGLNVMLTTLLLFQEEVTGWDFISLWRKMGWGARSVVILLFLMSAWSIGVMIDRWIAFGAARQD